MVGSGQSYSGNRHHPDPEEVYIVTSAPQPEWTKRCGRDELIATFDRYHTELRQIVKAATEITKWPRSPLRAGQTDGAATDLSCWVTPVIRCGWT